MSTSNTQSGQTGPVFFADGFFYGLRFFNEKRDDLDFDRQISCVPDVHVLDSNTKILLDYTGCRLSRESSYLDELIKGISLGAGFTLNDAKYIDPHTGVQSDLSGHFTYSATFDKGIYGTVNTITTPEELDKNYVSVGFIEDFRAEFEVNNNNTEEVNTIKNSFGANIQPSFTGLGLRTGDFVKILGGTNDSEVTLHEVTSFYRDFNGHEIVQFGNSADFIDDDRIGESTYLRMFRVDSSEESQGVDTLLDAFGNAVAIDENSIRNLNGRVNVITLQASNGKFIANTKVTPTFVLRPGASYVFNLTHNSLIQGNHIMKISATEDGKWNGGSPHPDIYASETTVVFEPTQPGTFYYYCTNHPGMGGKIIVTSFNADDTLLTNLNLIDNSQLAIDTLTSSTTTVTSTTTGTPNTSTLPAGSNSGIYG